MSKSSNAYIAKTQGTAFTLYAICKKLGIPLTKEREEFQSYLERTYPTVIFQKVKPLTTEDLMADSDVNNE